MSLRASKYKTFNGKRYERAGQQPEKSKKAAMGWADFQRKVNNLAARVVPVSGGYEIYIRRRK